VYNFSKPALAIFDYLEIKKQWKELCKEADLYIFPIVINDIVPTHNYTFDKESLLNCSSLLEESESLVREIDWENIDLTNEAFLQLNPKKTIDSAWNNDLNVCLFQKAVSEINSNNTIYVLADSHSITDSEKEEEHWQKSKAIFKQLNTTSFSISDYKNDKRFKKYFENPKLLHVSNQDRHPSKFLHKVYAFILIDEIKSGKYEIK
jgi:hypothetical protein